MKKLTKLEQNSFTIPPQLQEIIIGSGLGDLTIQKQAVNTRLKFEQSLIKKEYINHLFDLFKDFCSAKPKISIRKPDSRTYKVSSSIYFYTYSLPCFNYYRELFFVNGVKVVPTNISELLTARGLAYWSADDGSKQGGGFILSSQSFDEAGNLLLIKALAKNFELDCTLQKINKPNGKVIYRIYIKAGSMDKFKSIVSPYFPDSMKYKLN